MVFNLYQAGYNVKLSIMAPLSPTAVLAIWHSTSIQIIIHTTKKSSFCEDFFVYMVLLCGLRRLIIVANSLFELSIFGLFVDRFSRSREASLRSRSGACR